MKLAPPSPPKTILIVEEEDPCRITTSWFLANFGHPVSAARSAEEALALFDPEVHDVVLTGNSMPGISGAELAHTIKLRSPATLVVMYSGQPPADQSCLDLVIQRPAHLLTLKEALDKLIAARHSEQSVVLRSRSPSSPSQPPRPLLLH